MSASIPDVAERRLFETGGDGVPATMFAAPDEGRRRAADALPPAARRPWPGLVAKALPELGRACREAASLEMARGTAFCFVPVMLMTGALSYFFAPFEPPFWMLAAAAAVPLAVALVLGSWPALRIAFAALFCIALGALLAKAETLRAGTSMLGSEISTRLTGRIVSIDHLATGRVRLLVDVAATDRPKLRYAPDRVRVSARDIPPDMAAGDVVTGVVRLLPPLGPTRPGGYDFAFESYFDGIGAVGFFLTEPEAAGASQPPSWSERFAAGVENARAGLAARIRSRIEGPEGEIAAALVAGVRAGIPEAVNESLRRTGLAHILSISGLHMALVAAWIMGAMRLGFACFQGFAVRHPVRKYAAAVALLALAAYLFVSGYQVAAQRSFIMIAIMLVAVLFDRAALTMRNLALAAIVIVTLSPHEAAGPSFQMSFAATAALIGAYAAWSERKRRRAPSSAGMPILPRTVRTAALYVGGLAATSLLAGAATAIFGAYHFQRVSPLGLVANLAAMPVVSLLVMPFAVLGVVLMPLGLDWLAFSVMGRGLSLVIAISDWFSARSPLDAVGIMTPGAAMLLSVALVLASLLTTWLRVVALPFAVVGLALCLYPVQPEILVSEDARLVAFRSDDGILYVNRKRPNGFTIENWQRAAVADAIARPILVKDDATPLSGNRFAETLPERGFRCSAIGCAALSGSGVILTTADADLARSMCGKAGVIVLDDPTADRPCAGTPTLVVTRRDVALRGSAMIFGKDTPAGSAPGFGGTSSSGGWKAQGPTNAAGMTPFHAIRFAIAQPYRPWHAHRRFSREARGLAPWKPDSAKPDGKR